MKAAGAHGDVQEERDGDFRHGYGLFCFWLGFGWVFIALFVAFCRCSKKMKVVGDESGIATLFRRKDLVKCGGDIYGFPYADRSREMDRRELRISQQELKLGWLCQQNRPSRHRVAMGCITYGPLVPTSVQVFVQIQCDRLFVDDDGQYFKTRGGNVYLRYWE